MNFKLKSNRQTKPNESGKRRLPTFAKIFYIFAALSALLYVAFLCSKSFSDFFNRHIASVFRAVLAHITGWIPFSLAEMLVIMIPVMLVAIVVFATKRYADTWHDVFIFCGSLISIAALIFSLFTITFASAYRGSTLDEKLDIDRRDVSAEELYDTANILAGLLNDEVRNIAFEDKSFSVMPYGYSEMNDKLMAAYDKAYVKYDFLQKLDSKLKPVMLSELMSYTHITGVYSFFTGEANINVAFPDYTIPYTAAHELAHQRGIAREDEANFVAFLVCMESDDSYIRYSAYLNLYEYVASALSSADRELYLDVSSKLSIDIKYEMNAYSEFYQKYRNSVAAEVSNAVNNTFLVIQGTEGTKSYGMVVDLAVAYYRNDK